MNKMRSSVKRKIIIKNEILKLRNTINETENAIKTVNSRLHQEKERIHEVKDRSLKKYPSMAVQAEARGLQIPGNLGLFSYTLS
jgi:hypothetical protein